MKRNSEGKIVDENEIEVFKSDGFKQLSGPDHLIKVCPNSNYLKIQIDKVHLLNPEDSRNFIQFHSSRLLDDNASLASEEVKHNEYLDDVTCFLGMVNGLSKNASPEVKNSILGGVFPTKNDNSNDSMIPLYLVSEMLEAKCLKDLDRPTNNLDNYDVTENSQLPKDSTLGKEFDKVVEDLKKVDYDKLYFNQDMSDRSKEYLSLCQIDPTGSVDIFAKCEDDKRSLFVTQGEIVNSVEMFSINKEKDITIDNVNTNQAAITDSIPEIEKPVIDMNTNNVNNDVLNSKNINNNDITIDLMNKSYEEALTEIDEANKMEEEADRLALTAKEKRKNAEIKLRTILENRFKKTPAEKQVELQQMLEPQIEQAPSINAARFK